MSDGIGLCPHPPSQICYDEHEGSEICTLCGLVLSLGGPLSRSETNRRRDETELDPEERVYFALIADLADGSMIHPSVVRGARERIKSFLKENKNKLSSFSYLEIAACAIYAASVDEKVDYTIREIAAVAKVSEAKIFRLAKMFGCKLLLDPAHIVERIVTSQFYSFDFSDIKAIKIKMESFPAEKVQSLAPQTVVSAGIYLHGLEKGKPLPLPLVAERCGVHKKSLQSALSALLEEKGGGPIK